MPSVKVKDEKPKDDEFCLNESSNTLRTSAKSGLGFSQASTSDETRNDSGQTVAKRWFSADHFWIEIMVGVAKLGRTNYRVLNDSVDFVSLPKIGVPVKKNETVGFLKIVNTQPIICPLKGVIIDINQEIMKQPCLLLTSPMNKGWICKIAVGTAFKPNDWMTEKDYMNYISRLKE
ncbi:hypothetical protein Btru_046759 [Bulinus truncatus]|nr:hypothetical protein Btru_046759 [Bulinus truncatus]